MAIIDYRISIVLLALSTCFVTSKPLGSAASVADSTIALLMKIAENVSNIKDMIETVMIRRDMADGNGIGDNANTKTKLLQQLKSYLDLRNYAQSSQSMKKRQPDLGFYAVRGKRNTKSSD
ncbi:uncharacterized protein LOC135497908 [Lineus longissimus]|uniref:uncharacterized protein LOC135497908 n=1 Tax=Lineus longissimus TaxID=88925 RepID=UPI002B4C29D1